MKRFTTIFSMVLITMFSVALVSCDEDAEVAATLNGTWQGNVYVSSRYNDREYKASESKVQFIAVITRAMAIGLTTIVMLLMTIKRVTSRGK